MNSSTLGVVGFNSTNIWMIHNQVVGLEVDIMQMIDSMFEDMANTIFSGGWHAPDVVDFEKTKFIPTIDAVKKMVLDVCNEMHLDLLNSARQWAQATGASVPSQMPCPDWKGKTYVPKAQHADNDGNVSIISNIYELVEYDKNYWLREMHYTDRTVGYIKQYSAFLGKNQQDELIKKVNRLLEDLYEKISEFTKVIADSVKQSAEKYFEVAQSVSSSFSN